MQEQTTADDAQTKGVRDVGVVIQESENNRPVIEPSRPTTPGAA